MRASDIVRGKMQSLKVKDEEEKSLSSEAEVIDRKDASAESAFQAMDGESSGIVPMATISDAGLLPGAVEQIPQRRQPDVVSEEGVTSAAQTFSKPVRLEPEYRLSDFDAFSFVSLPKRATELSKAKESTGEASEKILHDIGQSDIYFPAEDRQQAQIPSAAERSDVDTGIARMESSRVQPSVKVEEKQDVKRVLERLYNKPVQYTEQADISLPQERREQVQKPSIPERSDVDPGMARMESIRVQPSVNVQGKQEVERVMGAAYREPASSDADLVTSIVQGLEDVKQLYQRVKVYLGEVRERVKRNELIDLNPAIGIIKSIIEMHYDMDAVIYQMTVDISHEDDYFYSHALNTTIYTVRIGHRLGYNEKELKDLGLSGLLCDIGMFKIPESILNKNGKLSQEEIDIIKSHPQLSRDILLPFSNSYQPVIDAIFEHQERENGQGYPRGIKGDEICEGAKIIGICDSYEAMTHNRPHKKALMQTDSIRELIGSKNQLFSPKIIKTFLDEISIYPVGSYIRLNNKNIGRVIATNRSNPLKPTIKLFFDETGKRFPEPRTIDLKMNPVLNIEGSVHLDELPQ